MTTQIAETESVVSAEDQELESNGETTTNFGAQSAPTFVLFVDGQPVKQLRGGETEQSLRELIAAY